MKKTGKEKHIEEDRRRMKWVVKGKIKQLKNGVQFWLKDLIKENYKIFRSQKGEK